MPAREIAAGFCVSGSDGPTFKYFKGNHTMARGGKREGSGRPRGSRSAATKEQIAGISDLAKMHSDVAINALVQIATAGESEAARVSAANSILDRAWGKPQQSVDHTTSDGSMTPISGFDIVVASAPARDDDPTAD